MTIFARAAHVPAFAALAFALLAIGAHALPNTRDTRFLSEPAVSATQLAFTYAGDIWVANLDGAQPRRITSDAGDETGPVFSPDGKWIAFNGQYEGNVDVYIVPSEGGVPRRLTYHPGPDQVQGFTPDGKAVLFTSPRVASNNRYRNLFTVPIEGGVETQLEIPTAWRATYSPDGKRLAYNPYAPPFLQWKHYRGGLISQISLFTFADKSVEKIPQPAGGCNDVDAMWVGDTIYFRSDRDGELNLYAYDTKSRAVTPLTKHADFPVLSAGANAGRIVYEKAGYLHALDAATGNATRLAIGVASDLSASRPRFVKGAKYIRNWSLSPSGARVALEFRGEIVTLPADKGDVRNLTQTVAAHERWPVWSPDGRSIAYFSDESGEYELHVRAQDGKGAAKKYKLSGAGYYDRPEWSPDSRRLAYTDNAWSLYVIDLATGGVRKVATEGQYGPRKTIKGEWSPDSRWLAYTLNSPTYTQTVMVYSVSEDKSHPVTDGLTDVSGPVFDPGGKYLYFLASTDAGPSNNWFSLENQDNRPTRSIWLAVLRRDVPSPLAKESDEEKGAGAKEEKKDEPKKEEGDKKDDADAKKDDTPAKKDETAAKVVAKQAQEPVRIDFDGITQRIVDFPVKPADISELQVGQPGQVFWLRNADEKKAIQRFDLKERKTETLLAEADSYEVSRDGKKILWRLKENYAIGPATAKTIPPAEGKLRIDAIEVRVDPRAEWNQIFNEAWRINRDYFYDPGMHGANWNAMRERYSAFLPELATRSDLFKVIRWMASELVVGHSYQQPGESFTDVKTVPGGLLGADYEIANGRFRFRKVYGGLNWNPELRAPLTEPGVGVKAGEYLLAVDGKNVAPPASLYSFFENTAGKSIELTVGPNPNATGSRTVKVVPVPDEAALRNRDWVEGNIRKVDAATNGRVAYVYVPNTAQAGHVYFKRYFFPQAYKDAIIVDERFNGGGSLADYYITNLARKEIAWWAFRYGADMKTPSASIQGPKVMLTDETAGSGGDLLPYMFRQNKLGTIIGKRTWGGLVGILGFPVLMDGGQVTAPNLAFWTRETGWAVENEGVAPDIEVDQTPSAVIAGHDPQLEKAIEVILGELAKNPPTKPKRPPFPVKVQ